MQDKKMKVINEAIGMAISEKTVTFKRAKELIEMSDEEKEAWYEKLFDFEKEEIL